MANTYLTKESLSWIWSKIKTALSGKADTSSVTTALAGKKNTQSAVSDPSASGTSLTFISGITQNAQGVISPSKKTVSTMGAATSSAAGTAGLVPAPASGKQTQFLRGDGTWQTPTNTKNTAGSTDSSAKLFLIGATSQAASPQTYSHDTAYVGTDGCLYSGGTKVLTAHQDISGKVDKSVGQAAGDIMYFSAKSAPVRLAIGTAGQVLKVVNGVPSWGDVPVTPMTTSEIETACPYPQSGDIVFNTPTLNITRSSSEPTNASDGDIWIEA